MSGKSSSMAASGFCNGRIPGVATGFLLIFKGASLFPLVPDDGLLVDLGIVGFLSEAGPWVCRWWSAFFCWELGAGVRALLLRSPRAFRGVGLAVKVF